MFSDLKALVVVLTVAMVVFAVAARVCEGFIDPADFKRRRNVWLILTVVGFGAPSIWVFVAIAMPLMFFAAKRDPNPLALYVLLMFVIPNSTSALPTFGGIGQLFDLGLLRMMSLVILIPAVVRNRPDPARPRKTALLDWTLIAYCLLQVFLYVPYESATNTIRRALLIFLDTYIIYHAFSRLVPTRRMLGEIAATLVLVGCLLAPLAVFESVRGWLLYVPIPQNWGIYNPFTYLMRGDALRAQVSTGHSLVLGYTMSFCIGFWIYVQSRRPLSARDVAVTLVLCAGLLVSYSRGAWLMCVLLGVVFMALRPNAGRIFVRVLPAMALLGVVIYLSPLKEAVLDRLPLIGTNDQETIDYRQQLAEVSWRLIKIHPFLGDPFVSQGLEELRQGQGIIDLINGYITVTLYTGFVGLTLFVSFFVLAVWRCYRAMSTLRALDLDAALLGAALVACMLASMFFIATAGVGSIEYLLGGLMASYAALTATRLAPQQERSPRPVRAQGIGASVRPVSS